MRRQQHRLSNLEALYCKWSGGCYGIREIKMPQEHLWLAYSSSGSWIWHVVIGLGCASLLTVLLVH